MVKEKVNNGEFVAPDNQEFNETLIPVELPKEEVVVKKRKVTRIEETDTVINPLRKERIIVRRIPKQTGSIRDPKHVLYGGMAETAKRVFCVPLLRNGMFTDVLTKEEKRFFEKELGLEEGDLSVLKRTDNFWSSTNDKGISSVELFKQDNIFDLSNPVDYIKYKILLAWKDKIAPSMKALQDTPKATYEFVITSDEESNKLSAGRMNTRKLCYKELGKIEDDRDILRLVIETIDGRPTSPTIKLETLQVKADDLISANPNMFLRIVTDKQLKTKVLIKKAVEAGLIYNKGNYLFIAEGNVPMCEANQEPTFNIAAEWLDAPKNQQYKFSLQAKLQ